MSFESLPPIDDVLISHCHYDHLDEPTLRRLGNKPRYWVPGGLSPWLRKRGYMQCRELQWWEKAPMGDDVEIHCVPAQHFAARSPFDRNQTHWCGWVIRHRSRQLYFAGDTGYSPVFKEIGNQFGPMDISLIPIGAYRPQWLMKPMHVTPFEAVQIHLDVQSRQSIACHWGTFALADDPLDEAPRLLVKAMQDRKLPEHQFRALRFGETLVA